MKVLLWVLGVPILLIVAAALLLPILVDEAALVKLATEQIEKQSGVQVRVDGDASLSLFPRAALSTSDVTVELPDAGGRIEAGYLRAGVALLPLLSSSVEMDSITVEGLVVTTVAADPEAARAAELDTSTLGPAELDAFYAAREQARQAAAAESLAGALAAPLALEVGELSLRDIRVRSVDDAGELISEVQLRHFTASDLNTAGRSIPLSAQLRLPGDAGEEDILITIAGDVAVDLGGNRTTLSAVDVVVTGATPDPIELTVSGEGANDTQRADLDIALSVGTLKGDGSLRFAAFDSPMIDATLALTELNPALLLLAGPDAVEAVEDDSGLDADAPLPLHALRMIDTRAQLSIERVIVDAHTLENVKAALRIVDGVATLDPVTATLHGGEIAFDAVLDGHYNNAQLRSQGSVKGLDIARAVAATEAGVAARGSADLTWQVSGQGRTQDDLVGSLSGPIDFTTADVTLEGIAMERMFCGAVALVNREALTAEFPSDTAFEALFAKVQLEDGVARLQPLTAELAAVSLGGNGSLDLDSQDLRLSLRAQLSPELGAVDPACRVNERYAKLRWPVECKGNLADDPSGWCGVNTSEIVKDLAEGEVKRKVEEEAGRLLKKLFD
jgi:AsmA protein